MAASQLGIDMRGELGRRLLLSYLGAAVTLTGIQAVLPALPSMQRALGLSDTEVSLVISAYLVPSVLLAITIGLLTDRLGRREVYVGALTVFGLVGLPLLLVHSFAFLIGMRILQRAAFAAMLPLSITMVADVTTGRAGVRAQGHRSVAMTVFDAALPAAGGGLATWVWYGPFGLQLLALPLAAIGWWWLPPREVHRVGVRNYAQDFRRVLRLDGVWSLRFVGFSRFFFKFTVLTYFPILAASTRDMSPVAVGIALGAVSLTATTGAALAGNLVSRVHVATLLMVSMLLSGVALLTVGAVPLAVGGIAALLACGFADGLLSVLQNFLAGSVGPNRVRNGFVALTATTRNLGKFLAPLCLGGLVLVVSIEQAFLITGALAVLAVIPLRAIRPLARTAAVDIEAQNTVWDERTG